MIYSMKMTMFESKKDNCLIIEGGSPKGKYQFMCENQEARDLYNKILGIVTTFLELNQECVYESFDEMEKAHNTDPYEEIARLAAEASEKAMAKLKDPIDIKVAEVADGIKKRVETCEKYEDLINSPSHYTEGRKYEPRKVIEDWNLDWNLGNAVKYISRAGRKDNKVQDLEKAKKYIEWAIEEAKNGDN